MIVYWHSFIQRMYIAHSQETQSLRYRTELSRRCCSLVAVAVSIQIPEGEYFKRKGRQLSMHYVGQSGVLHLRPKTRSRKRPVAHQSIDRKAKFPLVHVDRDNS